MIDSRSSNHAALGGVLITRPAHQAGALAQAIAAAGGTPVFWPALEIKPPRDPAALTRLAPQLARAEIAIFISPNAVEQAVAQIGKTSWPTHLALAAVGEGTARTLRETLGRGPDLCPASRFDSEGLLALPALQTVAGKQVVIVRGEGGRELLAETLRARGATVEYAEVYRRACPDTAPEEARAALAAGRIRFITATSTEALHNLLQMAGEHAEKLRALPLIVVSERMQREAIDLGFDMPRVARAPSNEALVEALLAWANGRES